MKTKDEPMVITLTKGQVQGIKDAPEEFMREKKAKAILEKNIKLSDLLEGLKPMMKSKPSPTFEGGKMQTIKDAPEERRKEKEEEFILT